MLCIPRISYFYFSKTIEMWHIIDQPKVNGYMFKVFLLISNVKIGPATSFSVQVMCSLHTLYFEI